MGPCPAEVVVVCSQHTSCLVEEEEEDYQVLQGSADTNSAVLKKVMLMLLWCERCSKTGV